MSNEAPTPKTSQILSSVSIEHGRVTDRHRQTDGQTDRETDTGPWLVPALAQRRAGKNAAN